VLGQLGAREHLALALHQQRQQLELVAGQRQRLAVDQHARLARVQPDGPHCHSALACSPPAQQRAQARQQLFHVKGLGQVVVGAGVHARDLFLPAAARGQDQHRHVAPGGAPAAQHRQAVRTGRPRSSTTASKVSTSPR
jgi:hypothetical protein